MGVRAIAPTALLIVPANGFATGAVTLVEDDRVEHILGDDSTETVLGTVAI
jgi:hypothetical protein